MSKIYIQALRLRCVAQHPYLASALWSITLVESPGMGTMGVDKYWRVYVDPEVTKIWTIEEQVGVLVHEIQHLLRAHHRRAESLGIVPPSQGTPISMETAVKARVWNLAADYGINNEIIHEFKLPSTICLPSNFNLEDGKISEWYFEELMKKVEDGSLEITIEVQGQSNPLGGNDGSGATNIPANWEIGKDSEEYGSGMSEAEGELVRQQVARDIEEQKTRGAIPGFMQLWADERLNPKVDWRTKLMSAIRGQVAQVSGMVDYSYYRPSRRQSACPRVVLPTLRGTLPDIAIGVDTSGSMSNKDLARAMAEISGVLSAIACNVKVYIGDTQVYSKDSIRRVEDIKLIGGGGTDMSMLIDEMDKDKCNFAIIISDGYTPWPNQRPRHLKKVIVCLTQGEEKNNVPDFYETIVIRD